MGLFSSKIIKPITSNFLFHNFHPPTPTFQHDALWKQEFSHPGWNSSCLMAMLCTSHIAYFPCPLKNLTATLPGVSRVPDLLAGSALLSQQSIGSFSPGSCLPLCDLHQEPEVRTRHLLSTTCAMLSIPAIPFGVGIDMDLLPLSAANSHKTEQTQKL